MAYLPLSPSARRRRVAGAYLSFQPGGAPVFANVSAVRAGDAAGLTALAAEAAAWFASLGRTNFVWFLGPSTTPADAATLLQAGGATQIAGAPKAMLLDREPARGADADIRTVDDAVLLLRFRELLAPAGGGALTDELRAELAATNDAAWADLLALGGARRCYLAYDGAEPVAAATMLFTEVGLAMLSGGATTPHAQRRGFYRALVRARWEDAQANGYPVVATQAGDDSAPILLALGFTPVADLVVLGQAIAG